MTSAEGAGLYSSIEDDPLAAFYNLDGFTQFAITCDIDWAPDYAVEAFLAAADDAGLPVTCFATHASPVLAAAGKRVEVGLHPDNTFATGRGGPRDKLAALLDNYPSARGVRCHRNYFGQHVAAAASELGLAYDCSVFMWGRSWCQGFRDQFGLVRLCYHWEDGIHADYGLDWDINTVPVRGPGLKIFNFHPIFFYLNCPDDAWRRRATQPYSDLTKAPYQALESEVFKGYGARDFTRDLLNHLASLNARANLLGEIADAHCQAPGAGLTGERV